MIEQLPHLTEDRLRLVTKFGEFTADSAQLLSFPLGLPGFEACRRFALLSSDTGAPLQCLHAVAGPDASFLTLDPRLVLEGYRCVVGPADRERLQVASGDDLLWLTLLTIDQSGQAYANLRAPVVINPRTMTGFQVMPHDSLYPLRHPVSF